MILEGPWYAGGPTCGEHCPASLVTSDRRAEGHRPVQRPPAHIKAVSHGNENEVRRWTDTMNMPAVL